VSETLSETRDVNTCLAGSGLVWSGPVRVRLVEFGLNQFLLPQRTKKALLSQGEPRDVAVKFVGLHIEFLQHVSIVCYAECCTSYS